MSTTTKPLTMLWSVYFEDGHIIDQPEDDRYSKHDDTAEWNPSAFRDILEYDDKSPIKFFELLDQRKVRGGVYRVDLSTGGFSVDSAKFRMDTDDAPRKLIYFRTMDRDNINGEWQEPRVVAYNFGYEYKNNKGKTVKRIITLDGDK